MSINTTAARSDLALLHALIEMNQWRDVHLREAKADLIWQFPGHETENNQRIMSSAAIYNRLPGAGVGTNKAKFA